jgi:chromosome segregation ATPase
MFQRSHQVQYQRLQDTRTETMSQLIEPLRKYWPNMVSELAEAIQTSYGAARVGEVLAQEISKLVDALESEHRRQSGELWHKTRQQEKELKDKVDQVTKEKEKLSWQITTLMEKNEDLTKQIRIQNTLIADLHRKISNLTGATDESSST